MLHSGVRGFLMRRECYSGGGVRWRAAQVVYVSLILAYDLVQRDIRGQVDPGGGRGFLCRLSLMLGRQRFQLPNIRLEPFTLLILTWDSRQLGLRSAGGLDFGIGMQLRMPSNAI
jgi:hypothetical protein